MYLFLKIKLIRNRNYCTNYTSNYANTDTKYNARFVTFFYKSLTNWWSHQSRRVTIHCRGRNIWHCGYEFINIRIHLKRLTILNKDFKHIYLTISIQQSQSQTRLKLTTPQNHLKCIQTKFGRYSFSVFSTNFYLINSLSI